MLLAQVSDTHLVRDARGSVWGKVPATNLASLLQAFPPLDALAVTGDIADDGTVEAYRLAASLTDGVAARRYFIPGNHDNPAAMAAALGDAADVEVSTLSEHWMLVLVNSQWAGREEGRIGESALAQLAGELDGADRHVVLALHHPPLSPCPQPECRLVDADPLLDVLRGGPVRVVISGHLHRHFETTTDGIAFLGAPSTLNELCHGGEPHYNDTGAPPKGRLLELFDDGGFDHRVVTAPA